MGYEPLSPAIVREHCPLIWKPGLKRPVQYVGALSSFSPSVYGDINKTWSVRSARWSPVSWARVDKVAPPTAVN